MKTDLTAPHFTDEAAALAHYEAIRWPDGVHCLHCGSVNVIRMKGKTTRPGLHNCRDCRKPFRATMGTIYEKSHIPLHKWLLATHIMCASKKGVSAHQLWRMLGFGSYKTAWFMAHRIREAMRIGDFAPPMGGGGGAVEVDETFYGDAIEPHGANSKYLKNPVLSLVDRDSGEVRSFVVKNLRLEELAPILWANIAKEARVMTDEAGQYRTLKADLFPEHETVNHAKSEYVRGDITTNTVEGFYSIFKRGMRGIYQKCGSQHLHRYMAEFDFRYTNRIARGVDDNARTRKALMGTVGRRLTYLPLTRRNTETAEA
ncbi:MAG TPA: IS1595 family transposase [Terricaulis sp.]|nr:IS1595 family transposase [Terricaulis sp.]